MPNTDFIDTLVSKEALDSLDKLNKKLDSSDESMIKLLSRVSLLAAELTNLGKSNLDLAKAAQQVEEVEKKAAEAIKEKSETLTKIKKVTDEAINSTQKQTKAEIKAEEARIKRAQTDEKLNKSFEESLQANQKAIEAEKEYTQALIENEKTAQNTKRSTEELLKAVERTAAGIDISSYITENEKGAKNYSGAVNELSRQLGIIEGLQEAVNEKFQEGEITAQQQETAVSSLSSKQKEYEKDLESLQAKYHQTGEAQSKVFEVNSEAFSSLSPQVQQLTFDLVEENKILNQIRAEQKELDQAYKESEGTLQGYAQQKALLNTLEAEQAKSVKKLSEELKLNKQIADTAAGSYDNISAQYSLLKIEINALGEAEGQNTQVKRDLEKQAKSLYERMNELQKATGKAQLQVGDYTIINKELESAIKTLNPAVGNTITQIKGMTKAALAFIATPTGIFIASIVAGLTALYSWFRRSEEGQNALSVASAAFSQVLNNLLDIVGSVGEWLINVFVSPKEALNELGDLITNNLINRFKAFGVIGKAVLKIFTEDWKQGLRDLADGTLQLATGVENATDKIVDFGNKSIDAGKIQDQLNQIEKERRDLNLEMSEALAEQNRLRNIATDQEKSAAERQKANNAYMESVNKFSEKDIELQRKNLALVKERAAMNGNSKKDLEEINRLEIAINQAEAKRQQDLIAGTRTNNRLRSEASASAKRAQAEQTAAEKKARAEQKKELKSIAELESFNYRKSADLQKQLSKDVTISFEERRTALRAYIDDEIAIIQISEKEQLKQTDLTETAKLLIKEKAAYEIYKLEQTYAVQSKELNIKEAEDQVKKVKAIISERSEAINDAMQKDLSLAAKVFEEQIKLNTNNEKQRKQITEDYQNQRIEIIRKANQQIFEEEVELLEQLLLSTDLSENKKLEIQTKINELRKKNAKDLADFEIQQNEDKVKDLRTLEEKFNDFLKDKKVKAIRYIFTQALDIANSYYDNQLSRIDEIEKREKEYYDERLQAIDDNLAAGLLSQEQADAQKRIIEEGQAEREAEYEQQRKEIQRKQAIWNKANSIVQATINTAQAVTMAYTAGPIIGPILAGIISALGAAQIAIISAQQIPAYKHGGTHEKDGLALVGDGGRSEMVILPWGQIWKTPDTDTLTYLPKGSEILPDYKQAMINMAHPIIGKYDDTKAEMIFIKDDVLRKNTKITNDQLSKINSGIQSIHANVVFTDSKIGSYSKRNNKKGK